MLKQRLRKQAQKQQKTTRIMAFEIGHLTLGLPLEGVTKVVPKPGIIKGSQANIGLAQVADQDIIVLDVEERILGSSNVNQKGYLILFKAEDKTYDVPCGRLPAMREINQDEIQDIPADYRERDALGIASKMLTIKAEEQADETIFLVAPNELLDLLTAESPSLG